jgi:hypothetical protein
VPLALDDGTSVDVEPRQASAIRAAGHGLADDGSLGLHKPGFRRPAADAADGRRKKTRQLDPRGHLVATYETEEEKEDGMAMDARERAYLEMCDDLRNAWRKPQRDAAANGGYGSGEFRGQKAGDACTINGAPGTLVEISPGKFECRPVGRDAAPPRMDAAESQRIKDEAWVASVLELEEAWKR